MIITGLIFVGLGLVLGSFVNAWVWRTKTHKSVATGRSVCPGCKHQLAWYDLLPVVSWVALRAKCRYCHKPISAQYPVVELMTGLLFGGLYWYSQPTSIFAWTQFGVLLTITVLLVAALVYDALYMQLPEKFMLPAVGLAACYFLLSTHYTGWAQGSLQLLACAVFVAAYTALWYFSKGRWLGAGDIRVAAVMGLILLPAQLVVGVLAAYLLGAAWGVYLIITTKAGRKSQVAFGPFLIAGLYIGLFWGAALAGWYMSLI